MMDNLSITYKKVDHIDLTRSGYINIESVAKRHFGDFRKNKNGFKAKTDAVREFEYFLGTECREVLNKYKKTINVLDVGCGSGEYYHHFRNLIGYKINYSGIEISDSMVNLCKVVSPGGRFIKSFADNINFPENSFDLVFCSATLHYTIDRWKESLREMKRVSSKFVALLRLPVLKYENTCFVEQIVSADGYNENNYFILLNRKELENLISSLNMKIVKRDYSSEGFVVEGIDEQVVLNQYLLEKRN